MNNSKTPKIVVGVGLAAVYATGLAFFTLRGEHDNIVAQNASESDAPSAQIATEPVSPPVIAPELADTSTSEAPQPAAMIAAAAPAARVAAKTSPAKTSGAEKSSATSESTRAGNESVSSIGDEPSSVEAGSASPPNDSQITADVKSEIAEVALADAIDVTTKDGVVELTGSVPSQEVIDNARLAARNVADVRDVDASALMISN